MTIETKRGRGRPATLTPDARADQLREGAQRSRAKAAAGGKARIDAKVQIETRQVLEAYVAEHDLKSIGEAIDALVAEYAKRHTPQP